MSPTDLLPICLVIFVHVVVIGNAQAKSINKLLLISMDGFRYDYTEKAKTPNFDRIAEIGVRAKYINPPFTTRTFPCHYTLVTGLYEESHGIVSNRFYDPVFNATFSMSNMETRFWDAGEPIWITAVLQNLKAATYFWPGSGVKIHGAVPDYWRPYEQNVPFMDRVNTVVSWFSQNNVDVATLYFHEPDSTGAATEKKLDFGFIVTGHKFGPDSQEVLNSVVEMDTLLGKIMDKLKRANVTANVIVTSDHGMATISESKIVNLSKCIDLNDIRFVPEVGGKRMVSSGVIGHIWPKEGKTRHVYEQLKSCQPTMDGHMKVFLKSEVPFRYHYSNNRRIPPIFLEASEGWNLFWRGLKDLTGTYGLGNGSHGYDNNLLSMKPIFYAYGPDFKKNLTVEPFNSVDIYPLMCKLLNLTPAPNNGSLDNTATMLQPDLLTQEVRGGNNTAVYRTSCLYIPIGVLASLGIFSGFIRQIDCGHFL